MDKLSMLSVEIIAENVAQYIDGEKFRCYRAKHNDLLQLEVLISEYDTVCIGDKVLLYGHLRTDFGFQKVIVTRFLAIEVKPLGDDIPVNKVAVCGKINKLTDTMPLKSGTLVRQVFMRDNDTDKNHTNILKLNLVDKAARKSKTMLCGSYVHATGYLNFRKTLEVTIREYEEV